MVVCLSFSALYPPSLRTPPGLARAPGSTAAGLAMSKEMVSGAGSKSFKHDKDAKMCDVCDKWFSLTNRRHHCRGCRAAVCSACSPKRHEVPDWDGLQRVCDECHEHYSAPGGDPMSPITPPVGPTDGLGSPGSPRTSQAVPWAGCVEHFKADRDEKACPSCKKGFSAMRRRHHCRVCGGVFCGPCSKDKRNVHPEEVPGWGGLQRVCGGCSSWIEPSASSELTAAQFCVVHKDTPVFADAGSALPPSVDERAGGAVDTLKKGSMVQVLCPLAYDYLGVSWCRVAGGWVAPGGEVEDRGFKLLQMNPGPDVHLVQIIGGDNIRKAQQYLEEVSAFNGSHPGTTDPSSAGEEVVVVFKEPGSIGLELKENAVSLSQRTLSVSIVALVPGTQSGHHRNLSAGLTLSAVGGKNVIGKSLDEVFEVIIGHPQRPMEMRFQGSGSAGGGGRPMMPRATPAAAAKHPDIVVVFAEEGSVGMDLAEGAGPSVSIEKVKAGTQAVKHPALKAGLVVTSVAGQSVVGKSLDDVFDVIIGHPQRPITFVFEGDGSTSTLADFDPMAAPAPAPDPAVEAAAKKKAARENENAILPTA